MQKADSRPTNTRDIQMAKGKHKTISSRSQYVWASSELSSPTTVSPEYKNTAENQEADLRFYLIQIIEFFKEDINNSLKYRKTGKQVKELKAIQDLKVEGETIKKNTNGGKPGNGKPRKEVRNCRCKYHQQNTRVIRENLRCRRYYRRD